ncbi:DUF5937 family protein [Streptomyces sp. ZYX-F-203]
MSVTIDVRGLAPERVAVVPSPLAELGMALHALAEPGHHPGLRGWAAEVTTRLDPHLADRMCEADFLWRTTFSDLFLAFAGVPGGGPPGASLAEELDLMDRLSDERFADAALEFVCARPGDGGSASVLADRETRRWALDLAAARGPRQLRFSERLLADPPRVRAWLREFVVDCDEAFFAEVWARLRPGLHADARHRTELLRHRGLAAALSSVSTAVSLDEDTGLVVVDKLAEGRSTAGEDGLSLVPTSLGRPHLVVLHRPGWRPVLHYPVHAGEPAPAESPARRMAALAHPLRTRLCRDLARGAYTTGELALTHGITAPEVSRHLAVLRRAGLLTSRRRGRYVQYRLDATAVARLSDDFLESVLR